MLTVFVANVTNLAVGDKLIRNGGDLASVTTGKIGPLISEIRDYIFNDQDGDVE